MDNPINNSSPRKWLNPLIYACLLIAGVVMGSLLASKRQNVANITAPHEKNGKLDNVLDFIEDNYVDTINRKKLEENTLTAMLHQLDPHSDYIPAAELEQVNEPLQGNFHGIGINVGIKREGQKQLLDFTITRGEIPIYSVDASIMVEPGVGYIKISRFAASTYEEFRKGFNKLTKQGMQQLIIDLRGNGGGYLNAAVDIADEFLNKGMLIVYTKGKNSPEKKYIMYRIRYITVLKTYHHKNFFCPINFAIRT